MAIIFYPHEDELESSTVVQRLEVLLESAERYKAIVLDLAGKGLEVVTGDGERKAGTPRDITHSYNWAEIARLLGDIRALPESSTASKLAKADRLAKLAEIYEVLRGAKMAKLEAVRLALINEAKQLGGSGASGKSSQVA